MSVLVYCTLWSIYVGVSTICVHNTMSVTHCPPPQLRPSSAERWSDLSLTNSFATSSLLRWERMRSTVRPVSSMWMRLPSGIQQVTLPLLAMSFTCSTPMPTVRSSLAKQ